MEAGAKDFNPRHKRDTTLIASYLTLAVFAGVFLWLSISNYYREIQTVSMSENRFITLEWNLLQTLKAQTETQLLQKDKEIADLRGQFDQMSKADGSAEALLKIQNQLQQAQRERDQIIAQRLNATMANNSETAPAQDQAEAAATTKSPSTASDSEVMKLLQSQIKNLETLSQDYSRVISENQKTIEEQSGKIASLQKAVKDPQSAANPKSESDLLQSVTAAQSELHRQSALIATLQQTVRTYQTTLRQRADALKSSSQPSLDSLNNRALFRALLNSPEIRASHPDLVVTFDKFFEQYGNEQKLQGQRDAYAAAAVLLDSAVQGSDSK